MTERAEQRHRAAEQIAAGEREPGEQRMIDEEHAGQQHVDRQPRRTAHERRDQDRREPIAAIGNQPRRHDAGQRAGVRREQRHEGMARQAEAAQHAIHHEGGAREIAGVLEQADEEEQQADLRQEDDRASDAADDAVGGEVADRARAAAPSETQCPRCAKVASIRSIGSARAQTASRTARPSRRRRRAGRAPGG